MEAALQQTCCTVAKKIAAFGAAGAPVGPVHSIGEVLAEFGFPDDEIDALIAEGVVRAD